MKGKRNAGKKMVKERWMNKSSDHLLVPRRNRNFLVNIS